MSRSRYYPGYRYDRCDMDEWYAYKRRREDIETGWVRVRIYGSARIKARRRWLTSEKSDWTWINAMRHDLRMAEQRDGLPARAEERFGATHPWITIPGP